MIWLSNVVNYPGILLPLDRLGWRFDDELIKIQIQPAAELESHLTNRARMRKAESLVQLNADSIL